MDIGRCGWLCWLCSEPPLWGGGSRGWLHDGIACAFHESVLIVLTRCRFSLSLLLHSVIRGRVHECNARVTAAVASCCIMRGVDLAQVARELFWMPHSHHVHGAW